MYSLSFWLSFEITPCKSHVYLDGEIYIFSSVFIYGLLVKYLLNLDEYITCEFRLKYIFYIDPENLQILAKNRKNFKFFGQNQLNCDFITK
jgi:hypothetical protein